MNETDKARDLSGIALKILRNRGLAKLIMSHADIVAEIELTATWLLTFIDERSVIQELGNKYIAQLASTRGFPGIQWQLQISGDFGLQAVNVVWIVLRIEFGFYILSQILKWKPFQLTSSVHRIS